MSAVWMRFRVELRGRWRALVALALLSGVPAGLSIVAATAASRTASAPDRLVAATHPPNMFIPPDYQETKFRFEDVAAFPVVSEALLFHSYAVTAPTPEDLEVGAFVGDDLPPDRTHLVDGRLPRPGRVDEATISFVAQQRYHWHVGDSVDLHLATPDGEGPGPVVRVRIVGVTANAGDFVGVAGPGMEMTSAFAQTYDAGAGIFRIFMYSFKRGYADLPAFNASMDRLTGGQPVLTVPGNGGLDQVRRTFRIQAAALWVSAAFIAAVAALIFMQAFARETLLNGRDRTLLRALGMTPAEQRRLALMKAGFVALVASLVAAALGAGLSVFTPLGTPRFAEPDPGLWLPTNTFAAGIGITLIWVVVIASLSDLFAARGRTRDVDPQRERPSVVARAISGITGRPVPAVGARFALEAGRGATAVPVRSSLAASVTGIAALLAALTVGGSLTHLVASPRLYGWNWDKAIAGSFEEGSDDLKALLANPDVADVGIGGGFEGTILDIGGVSMDVISIDPVKGAVGPTLLSGTTPRSSGEIALGPKSLSALHVAVGDTVAVGIQGKTGRRDMRVVGEAVLPFDDDISTVGEGAWITFEAARELLPASVTSKPPDLAFVGFALSIDRTAAAKRLHDRFPDEPFTSAAPQGVRAYKQVSIVPRMLAGLLAALAVGTLAHMLVSSIRRRRRDFAILKTIGFTQRQLRSAVGWQANIFMFVALLVAVPAGFAVGRWVWILIARAGGFVGEPSTPGLAFLIVGLASFGAAMLLAALPARSAGRTPAAVLLRAE